MVTRAADTQLPLARRLALQARESVDRLPAGATAKAKTCLLDFLGCAFEAAHLPWSRQVVALARRSAPGARILGTDIVAHPCDAAFANAVMGHGLVREDMHAASISHHGVVIWPSLLALAEERQVSGDKLLRAAVIAYEGGARVGRALFNADLARLFRPTGLVGPIGAALGASVMRDYAEADAAHAMSLAINTAGGLNQWPHSGASEMYFHVGFAARNVVTAVWLAGEGAYASEDIFEGEAGLFAAYRRAPAASDIMLFPEGQAEIFEVYNKPVPACNFAQTACQAALQIVRDEALRSSEIASVDVRVSHAAIRYPGCDYRGPYERALQAKMSIQYGVAAALARGQVTESNYTELNDPEILRLIAAVTLTTDDSFTTAFPARQGSEVAVMLKDGRRLTKRLEDVVAATPDEVRARFHAAASEILGVQRADDALAMVDSLDSVPDIRSLIALCVPASTMFA